MCGGTRLYRDGLRYLANGEAIQRWLCRTCGYRFTEKNCNCSNRFQHTSKVDRQILNCADALTSNCQGSCEALSGASSSRKAVKALTEVETRIAKRAAGATAKSSEAELHGKIVEFLWWMKKQGYKETTIRGKSKRLSRLVKLGADLFNPESVKEVIAAQSWNDSSKETTVHAYESFLKWAGLKWEKPRYKALRKLPFIPHEREIDDLIAGCSNSTAVFLQIIKETGARSGEVFNLEWIDVDLEGETLRITPEKGSNPRVFKISKKLRSMLENLPKRGEKIFNHKSLNSLRRIFERKRQKIAYRLGNPRMLKISFHTLRHWKATIEYHRTKDILHVMQMLGHRNIKNTLIYTQLIDGDSEDAYVCKVARTVEQASELIEAGFEYVCEMEDFKLFRKRK
jgi:integrase